MHLVTVKNTIIVVGQLIILMDFQKDMLEDLIKEFKDKNISFTCIKMNDDSDKRIKII